MNRREFLSSTVATMAAGTLIPRALADGAPQKSEGMNYAPQGKPNPVVKPGEFVFAAARPDHGHIYGMCNGLLEAGATMKWRSDERRVALPVGPPRKPHPGRQPRGVFFCGPPPRPRAHLRHVQRPAGGGCDDQM